MTQAASVIAKSFFIEFPRIAAKYRNEKETQRKAVTIATEVEDIARYHRGARPKNWGPNQRYTVRYRMESFMLQCTGVHIT